MSQAARYLVGIDLGTINTALAYVDLAREGDPAEALSVFSVPQLVAPGETANRRLLPSNAYLPGPHELAPGATRLPWGEKTPVVGEFAREQGAKVPGRLVSSAKSWLSNPRVDRTAAILPWGAPEEVAKISPVRASALYLAHVADAWRFAHPEHPLEDQEVVLTVPASFDEVARELTVGAAHEAGLARLTLLEEPQAAFYDFTARHRGELGEELGPSRLILVCDVGGGTTDFTLIHSALTDGAPVLTRIAVGDHLLLGGDNIDIALARRLEARLGARLDTIQWSLLVQSCRRAKERLLEDAGPERVGISVAGRGSRLLGGTLSCELSRNEVREVLFEGFFPSVATTDLPRRRGRTALQELGLPYEAEPAVTRHALAFLQDHRAEVQEALGKKGLYLSRPDALLLNGGVFTPREVRSRLVEVISSWFPGEPPVRLLGGEGLDVAVARGAAYSALVRQGLGLRIGGGSPRSYFVGVEIAGEGERRALCVIPRHLEEGREIEVPQTFGLRLDRPVRFDLYATSRARLERPGVVVPVDEASFTALPPIETVLRSLEPGSEVPVRLHAALTEIGTLDLWCVATDREARWKLEFQLRASASDSQASEISAMPKRFGEARSLIDLSYGKKPAAVEKRDVKGLFRSLEKVLGPKEGWTTALCRELWAALHAGQGRRRRTADHERLWLSLVGYCLRPGFGAPLDGWRAAETFRIFDEGLQFQGDPHNWQAWWVLWRRIAGGVDADGQARLFERVQGSLPLLDPARKKKAGARPEGLDEIIRLVGSLERLDPARKCQAATWLVERIEREGPAPHLTWALGRLGARIPFYGSGHAAIPKSDAEAIVERLLVLGPRRELIFPLVQVARISGDRSRDLEPDLRARVLEVLEKAEAPEDLIRPAREWVELELGDEQQIFGESLPPGLRLIADADDAVSS